MAQKPAILTQQPARSLAVNLDHFSFKDYNSWNDKPKLNPEFLKMYAGELRKLRDSCKLIPIEQHDAYHSAIEHLLEFTLGKAEALLYERLRDS